MHSKLSASLLLSLALLGCTMAPPIVTPSSPSLDGGVANSGLLSAGPGDIFVVTQLWAERYTNLCKLYGSTLNPPMPTPRWIVPTKTNTFTVTGDAMKAFGLMNFHFYQHQTP